MGYNEDVRHIRESLSGFYEDAAYFWSIFDETPQAAVAAFKARPEIFGALTKAYRDWPKMRSREHARISDRLLALLAEHPPDVVGERELIQDDVPA